MVVNNSGSRLFISYSRKNKKTVYALADALAKAGIEIWIDCEEIDPFDDFPARIRDGLARSHGMLAWYTPEYAQSSYCQKELTAAWICTQRVTLDVLSRILIVNPEESVAHIALGDVGRQNYLHSPKDETSLVQFIQSIRDKLASLSGDFAALYEFKKPDWYPASQPGSSRFFGRLQELWRIHTALNPVGISDHENPGVMVQLTGLGGIGKSLLAIEYAKRFGAAYPGGIHWLRAYGFDPNKQADSEARERERQRQIEDLALLHDIPIRDMEFREVLRDLGKKLATGGPYLWIVDDLPAGLDQAQGLPGWCAPSGNGHTLITTCSKEYAGLGITVVIDVLDPAAALELLTHKCIPQNEQERLDAQGLTEELGRHALALDVAGHFLLNTKGFAALRAELAKTESDPLGSLVTGLVGQLPGGHEKSIVATILRSVGHLGEEGMNLLRLACELHGDTPIPLLLAKATFSLAFKLGQPAVGDYLTRALNQLEMQSVAITLSDALSIHNLVLYSMRHCDPVQEGALLRRKLREAAVEALVSLQLDIADIRVHARHLTAEPHTLNEALVSTNLAQFEGERGNYREALVITTKALPVLLRVLGVDDSLTLLSRASIAFWTGETGYRHEALWLFRELLPDMVRVLGPEHPHTLTTLGNISSWTGENGNRHEALRLSKELLPIQLRVLGTDHPETFRTRANIASWTGEIGGSHKALWLFQNLLSDQIRVFGAEHYETLRCRMNIACWTGETGDVPQALQKLKALLIDKIGALGEDHPDTLSNRLHIARWIGEAGDRCEALRQFSELLPDMVRLLGPEHPNTLTTRHNLACFTENKGESLRLFNELLPDRVKVLGPDHPHTLKTQELIRFLERHKRGLRPEVTGSCIEPHQRANYKIGHRDKAKQFHGKQENLSTDLGQQSVPYLIPTNRGMKLSPTGDMAPASFLANDIEAYTRNFGNSDVLRHVLLVKGHMQAWKLNPEKALQCYQELESLLKQVSSNHELARMFEEIAWNFLAVFNKSLVFQQGIMNSAEFQNRAEQMDTILGYPHYATTYFRKAVALRNDFARAWEGLGEALEHCGNDSQAIEIYRSVLTMEHCSMEVTVRLATLLITGANLCDRNQAQEAISLLQNASRVQPQDVFIHLQLLQARIFAGEIAQGPRDFRNFMQIEPEWTQFHYEVIENLVRKGRGTELRRAFEQATEFESHDFENLYGLGIICQCLDDQLAASSAYREAINIAPSKAMRAVLYYNLGIAMAASGKLAEAIPLYEKAVTYSSTLAEPHFALAKNSLNQDRWEEAEKYLNRFLQLGKPYLRSYLDKARVMLFSITGEP